MKGMSWPRPRGVVPIAALRAVTACHTSNLKGEPFSNASVTSLMAQLSSRRLSASQRRRKMSTPTSLPTSDDGVNTSLSKIRFIK